jgi:hypothetical protein
MLGVVNVASHLWRVNLGPGAGSTRVVPFRHTHLPLLGSVMPSLGLGATRFDQGRVLPGLAHLALPTDYRAPSD